MSTKPARGTNVFRDAIQDAERMAINLRVMDDKPLSPLDIAALNGSIQRLLDSMMKVNQVYLRPGDELDLDIAPLTPPDKPIHDVNLVMNDDVLDGLAEDGFFDKFTEGEERTRAMHALASMDETIFQALYIGNEATGTDVWCATGISDAITRALLIMAGKAI